ncbi:META domain-containing protein [Patescibacteria group bacterium]|nr:META domain-containing protein [Patescibacteria group bacterium]
MKTSLIWTLLLTALAGTILFLVSQVTNLTSPFAKNTSEPVATTTAPLTFDQATVYTCSDDSVVAAAFKTGDTTVLEVSLPNSNPLVMIQVEAASGARYTHESGIAFWEQGGVALVEKDGEVIFANCQVKSMVDTAATATSTSELSGTQWVWTQTSFATASSVEPNEPEDFILTFSENNRFSANTDCNNVGGGFVGGTDGAISFSEMVSTLMACEGDIKEGTFVSQLGQVVSYRIVDTELTLSLKSDADNGEMKFTKK